MFVEMVAYWLITTLTVVLNVWTIFLNMLSECTHKDDNREWKVNDVHTLSNPICSRCCRLGQNRWFVCPVGCYRRNSGDTPHAMHVHWLSEGTAPLWIHHIQSKSPHLRTKNKKVKELYTTEETDSQIL